MNYKTKNALETKQIATKIAQKFVNKGGVIALIGELGAGKTTFTQGFAESLGITEKVISPTFVITRQHQIPGTERVLFHLDLYRMEDKIDLKNMGIQEMIDMENSILLIEWPEKVIDQLPYNTVKIIFTKTKIENERVIEIMSPTRK